MTKATREAEAKDVAYTKAVMGSWSAGCDHDPRLRASRAWNKTYVCSRCRTCILWYGTTPYMGRLDP